jgi:catalase
VAQDYRQKSAADQDGVTEPVLARAIEYWRNIDQTVGNRIAEGLRGNRIAAE